VSRLSEWLAGGLLITDGAWGTELQTRGLAPGLAPDIWNLDHPERVEAVARSYIEAGSQIILTNTFGGTRICLARYGYGEQTAEINRAGAAISRRAAETVREEMDFLGHVKLREVEAAQFRIIDIVRKLEAEGEIELDTSGSGDNEVV